MTILMRLHYYALVLLTILLAAACSGSPTSPSATSMTSTDVGARAALLTASTPGPNSDFPGTGTNPGLGAPNSCTNAKLTIIDIGGGGKRPNGTFEDIKLVTTKADGQTRGYSWRITRKDADKAPFSILLNTVGADADGRELAINPKHFDPGQYTAEVRPRFQGCPSEFGEWSAAREFSMPGDVVTSSTRPQAPDPDVVDE